VNKKMLILMRRIEFLWTGTNEGRAGGAFIVEVSFVFGFVQVGEAETRDVVCCDAV